MTTHSVIWNIACPVPKARRIVLVDMYWTRDKDPRVPLGHASLLAALRQNPLLDVRSLVVAVQGAVPRKIARQILALALPRTADEVDVAIGAYIWNERLLKRVLSRLRKGGFRGRIILGGPQVSYVQNGLEKFYRQADVFIRGHAETALAAVARSSRRVGVQGVHYANDVDEGKQAIAMIESLPSPLLDGIIDLRGQKFLRWETRRGCKFKCSFCQHRQADAKVKPSCMPTSRIDAEIDFICRSEVNDIAVLDPVFNSNEDPEHALRILKRFASNGYGGRLSLQCRAELVDDAFLDAAKGLNVRLEFGLQTVQLKEQKAIDRINNMGSVEAALIKVHARKIDHEVSLIFGLPEQTVASFTDSVRWCLERSVPVIKAFPLLLLRGTKLELEREKWQMVVDDEIMPNVVESSTFSRSDWERMQAISQALRETEQRHPALPELLELAEICRIDRARFQPEFVAEVK